MLSSVSFVGEDCEAGNATVKAKDTKNLEGFQSMSSSARLGVARAGWVSVLWAPQQPALVLAETRLSFSLSFGF